MTTLYTQLQTLLTATPLLWQSEDPDGYPVEAVRFSGSANLSNYENLGNADYIFQGQYVDSPDYLPLIRAFAGRQLTAYRKPTGEPCEYELLILVKTGWLCPVYVGLRTYVIQS